MGVTAAIMFAGSAITKGVGAVAEANAQREQGKYQKHMMEVNAKMAEDQGDDAIRLGDLEANKAGQKASALRGSQRAAYAAQGIDVNSGVAAETQADTVALSKLDEITIKNNAWRTAWGYKVEALNSRSKGEFAKIAADKSANNTLLTGGISALGEVAQSAMAIKGVSGGGKSNTKGNVLGGSYKDYKGYA